MAHGIASDRSWRVWSRRAALAAAVLAGWLESGGADTITLRGGGALEGKVLPDSANKDRVQVWMTRGRTPLVIERSKILEITPKASPLDAYFVKKDKVADTVQAQYDLGAWCDQNTLRDLARVHYEAALRIDKSFEPAHKKLGHVFHDGYWLDRDELNRTQGMVKYKGRWISAEERVRHELESEAAAVRMSWVRQISQLRQAFLNGTVDRQREAEGQLMAIRDPDAVGALVRVFGAQERTQRILLAHILSKIPSAGATRALVGQVIGEPAHEVRSVLFDRLKERDDPAAVASLVKALGRSDVMVINRAAWALGGLEAVDAVPRLLSVLVTSEARMVMATPEDEGVINATGGADLPLVPIAYTNSHVAFMTPPAVGPGVVAFGATSAPYYGMLPGLNGAPERRPDLRVATYVYRNTEVLAALEKLTGQNFGYNVAQWREWLGREFKPHPQPTRRAPQP